MSGRRENGVKGMKKQESDTTDRHGTIEQHEASSSSSVGAAAAEIDVAAAEQEETKHRDIYEEIAEESSRCDDSVNEINIVDKNRPALPQEEEDVQGEDGHGGNENFVHRIPVVVSDSERRGKCEQTGLQKYTNNTVMPDHKAPHGLEPTDSALENFSECIQPVPVSINTTAPTLPHPPPMEPPPHSHLNSNPGNVPDGGGELYYSHPPAHEAVVPPWMMTPPPLPVIHPFYQQQQQQQQIDHAVAYANAAAHVAWAAAQAVQQAVLQQQTNSFSQFPPPYLPLGAPPPLVAPPYLPLGAPPPLIAPPPPSWPLYMSPQAATPHNYNPHFAAPQYGQPELTPTMSNQLVDTEETPYFDRNDSYQSRRQQIEISLDNEIAIVRAFPDVGEETTMYHQRNSTNNNNCDDGRLEWYPRKRQQRLSTTESNGNLQQQYMTSRPPTREKIRRRLRSSDNDSSSSGGYYHYSKQSSNDGTFTGSCQSKTNHRNGSGRGHGNSSMNKKARSTSNETLIGKTGLVALFEWCNKRHCTPTFTIQKVVQSPPTTNLDDEFECIVFLEQSLSAKTSKIGDVEDSNCEDGFLHEWGRGYGRNKNAAKQESARRAMQALIPGVKFDEETGILIALPSTTVEGTSLGHSSNAANFLDDLAPNLAKRLEISCDDPPNRSDDAGQASGNNGAIMIKHKPSAQHKRTLGTYPETSTTSEDDDRSTYYASRGASICSVLLHTIIQIDKKRIPDMPTFTYELSAPVLAGNARPPHNIDAGPKLIDHASASNRMNCAPSTKQAVTRCPSGSFKCTAKLKILSAGAVDDSANNQFIDDNADKLDERLEATILEAEGLGGTKRDARHVASAKLLSLLFPECNNDMAKVKAAAEFMRDQYTANKIQKHHSNTSSRNRRYQARDILERGGAIPVDPANKIFVNTDVSFALHRASDPPLPTYISDFLADLCCKHATFEDESIDTNECEKYDCASTTFSSKANSDCDVDVSAESAFRLLGRQKQMDYLVDSTLHKFNELDDEGRLICGGGSEDDVGRTVLRRAEPSDISRIRKLMQNKQNERQVYEHSNRGYIPKRSSGDVHKGRTKHQVSDLSSTLADVTINGEMNNQITKRIGMKKSAASSMSHLWSSSSSTILLLCRAIAAYEDPPLGCAYLSFDFSMDKGKVLRVIEMGSESHLPQERFLDCLQSFANCMNFAFEPSHCKQDRLRYTTNDLICIVESFTKRPRDEHGVKDEESTTAATVDIDANGKSFQSLHPVQEESEGSDDDDSKSSGNQMAELPHQADKPPGSVKPSKRSRFQ